ncbi:MAG: hypothetical protein ABII90_15010 [Bacteroidota bacterium]
MKNLKTVIIYISIALTVTGMNSCEIINPEEDIPSYIKIEKIDLATDSLTEGTSSHKIVDAWVYIDDKFLGAYELPVTFPVLAESDHELIVRAGIKVNGIAETRDKYPFFDFSTEDVTLTRDSIISVNPVVRYYNTTIFEWMEDFEGPGTTLETTANSDTTLHIVTAVTPDVLGNKSAVIYLDNTNNFFECTTSGQYILPKGNPVFLELNYKCNITFIVGLFKNNSSQTVQLSPSLYINPSESWNKIYVNLTNQVKAQTDAINYEVYFAVTKNASVEYPEVYLDNIKLVHY